MRYLLIDINNSKNIHKYFNNPDIFCIKDFSKQLKIKYDFVWFADNTLGDITDIIEYYFKKKYFIVNNQNLKHWELNRRIGIEKAKLFGIKTPKSVYKVEDVDFEKGIIKPFGGAGYKNSAVFESKEELVKLLENDVYKNGVVIQEFLEGNEIAFGCYFVNSKPIYPIYVNREYKHSISKDVGGNTGQSAEFGVFTYPTIDYFERISHYLKKHNINYTGLIDINMMEIENELNFLEWTISRDGYPEIQAFLSEKDFIPALLVQKDFKPEYKFNYSLILRLDDIENKIKELELDIEIEKYNFIPEVDKVNDKYIAKTDDTDNIGILYHKSNELEEIDISKVKVNYPLLYYVSFNEEVKNDWKYIKKYIQ